MPLAAELGLQPGLKLYLPAWPETQKQEAGGRIDCLSKKYV